MSKISPISCCCLFTILSFFIPSSLCDETKNLASCLTNHNIDNFTLYSSNNGSTTTYSNLLNFSIQNLRFSGSSVPKPSAIILPENKERLGKIILCCRKWSFQIRLRSGGHSYEGTSSSVSSYETQFVVIDMLNLDKILVDLESETAWVEGGATLGQTYYAIAKKSSTLGFPAGACPTVGVGGHFSGGGFGFLSRKYGVSADNVVDALLVDAEGRILDREGMGEDVFWAIRGGGGGNWGIVYAWKIKLVKVPENVTAFTFSRTEGTRYKVGKLVEKWQNVAPYLDDELHLMIFMSSGLVQRKGISAIFQGLYQGPRTKAISILNTKFPELGIVEGEIKEMSWIESVVYLSGLNGQLQQGSVLGLKNRYFDGKSYFKTKSDYVQKPISRKGIQLALDILEKEPKAYALLEPHGGFMRRTSSDSIAFPHRRGNLFTIEYTVTWGGRMENVAGYIEWIRGFYESMRPYVSSNPRAAYVNYMDLDLGVSNSSGTTPVELARVWGEKYFLKNYDRLVKAKTLIDPNNVFKHEQSIPPILPKAEI